MSVSILLSNRRKTVRAPVNPFDKATVVSILPKPIREVKPTIQPGIFEIEKASYANPVVLNVGPSSWWREIDEEQPLIEIPVSAVSIADSIVRDYCNGILACDMGDLMPGLFWLPGSLTLKEVREKFTSQLEEANKKQRNWFGALVKMGDVLWARSQGNPLSISEDMKMAAQELGMTEKEWLKNFEHMTMVRCKACGNMNRDDIVICPNCKVVLNPEQFAKLGMKFAS